MSPETGTNVHKGCMKNAKDVAGWCYDVFVCFCFEQQHNTREPYKTNSDIILVAMSIQLFVRFAK